MPNSKKIFIKDRDGNFLLPVTDSSLVQYLNSDAQSETVKHALDEINSYVGGLGGITQQIVAKINDLDSDTLVNQPDKYSAYDTEHVNPYREVPTNSWLTYVQITDGKITKADYNEINADAVKYTYTETIVDETGTHTYTATTQVSERLTYLVDYTKLLAYEAEENAKKVAQTSGISHIYAETNSAVHIAQINGIMTDGTAYVDKIKIGVKLNSDGGLIYVDDTSNIGTDEYSTDGKKILTLGTFSYSHVNGLETYLHTIENSITQTSYDLTRNIENDIYSHLYEKPIPDGGTVTPESYTLASVYKQENNHYDELRKTLGETDDNNPNVITSYFDSVNTVKATTDYLYKKAYTDEINVADGLNGLVIDTAISPKLGRTIKVGVDDNTILIGNDNKLTTNLYIKYVKDDIGITNPKHQIILFSKINGVDTQIGDAIDASDFVKDSFLASAALVDPTLPGTTDIDTSKPAKSILQLVWNTVDADGHTIPSPIATTNIDLTQFIKPYKGSNKGIFIDEQTIKLGIFNGLEYANYTLDGGAHTYSYVGIKLDATNESEFLTVSDAGIKLNGVRSTISSAVSPITTGIKDANKPVYDSAASYIVTPAKLMVGMRTIVGGDKTFGFEYDSIELKSDVIQHLWTENKIVNTVPTTIQHYDVVSTYIDNLGNDIDSIKQQLGDGSSVSQIIASYLHALTYEVGSVGDYNGLIIKTIKQTDGAVNHLTYSYVDTFVLQTSLTPSAKADLPSAKLDDHETLATALSYITSENTKQDNEITYVKGLVDNVVNKISYTTLSVDTAHDTVDPNKFESSSYIGVYSNVAVVNGINTTNYSIQAKDIASAASLHNINSELSTGNNIVTPADKVLTTDDKHTDGALFFQTIGNIDIDTTLFI